MAFLNIYDLYFEEDSPQVLIAFEKHGSWYYDASTVELLAKACLNIVERRLNEGWYLDELDEESQKHNEEPTLFNRRIILTEKEKAERIIKMSQDDLNKAGKVALRFLHSRNSSEYERVELEKLYRP